MVFFLNLHSADSFQKLYCFAIITDTMILSNQTILRETRYATTMLIIVLIVVPTSIILAFLVTHVWNSGPDGVIYVLIFFSISTNVSYLIIIFFIVDWLNIELDHGNDANVKNKIELTKNEETNTLNENIPLLYETK